MQRENAIINSLPEFLQGVTEYRGLLGNPAEGIESGVIGTELKDAWDALKFVENSQNPQKADSQGIAYLEKRFKLSGPEVTDENLEQRRTRLLNRYRMRPPYTYGSILQTIKDITGNEAVVNYNESAHVLTVMSYTKDKETEAELEKTLRHILPASVEFVYTNTNNWSTVEKTNWAQAAGNTWNELAFDFIESRDE
ncbi:MAG: DUF2313 domain-containing protein [Clostridia bacterium]|nr:DUF2313 domain-containing protein [Clostridia bacterium]